MSLCVKVLVLWFARAWRFEFVTIWPMWKARFYFTHIIPPLQWGNGRWKKKILEACVHFAWSIRESGHEGKPCPWTRWKVRTKSRILSSDMHTNKHIYIHMHYSTLNCRFTLQNIIHAYFRPHHVHTLHAVKLILAIKVHLWIFSCHVGESAFPEFNYKD